jgi:WhiB family redox-sensing transcriptional regulator
VPDVIGTARPPGAQTWRWDWQVAAQCRGRDDLFFHPHGEREPMRGERDAAAKAVCARCPVRRECLAHALDSAEPYGVWGGLSETEREVLLHGPRPVRKR